MGLRKTMRNYFHCSKDIPVDISRNRLRAKGITFGLYSKDKAGKGGVSLKIQRFSRKVAFVYRWKLREWRKTMGLDETRGQDF